MGEVVTRDDLIALQEASRQAYARLDACHKAKNPNPTVEQRVDQDIAGALAKAAAEHASKAYSDALRTYLCQTTWEA